MAATILDGNKIAAEIRAEVAAEVTEMTAAGVRPGLAVILVGHNPASEIYVRGKVKSCGEVGIYSEQITPPDSITTEELLAIVEGLNGRADIDGILVQMPLPAQIRVDAVLDAIDPAKDVDGLTPVSAGRLLAGRAGLQPCTPRGVMHLLAEMELSGLRAIVLGRSVLVGRPMAALLTNANATVTIAHSRTRDLPAECRRADLVVAAIGRAEMIRGDWIKPEAVVIDVGINRLADGRLVGDVDYQEATSVASAITPVPGGVGPMTIACLLENTVTAAIARRLIRASASRF